MKISLDPKMFDQVTKNIHEQGPFRALFEKRPPYDPVVRFAAGGQVPNSSAYFVGESGPEIITQTSFTPDVQYARYVSGVDYGTAKDRTGIRFTEHVDGRCVAPTPQDGVIRIRATKVSDPLPTIRGLLESGDDNG
jgi:hypothetical protein